MKQLQHSARHNETRPAITVFNTDQVAPEQRLDRCSKAICALLSPTHTSALPTQGRCSYDASLRSVGFGAVSVTQYQTSPMRDVRSVSMIKSNPDEDFFFLKLISGSGALSQAGNEASIAAGDVVMYDSAREFVWEFCSPSAMQIIRIPRASLLRHVPHAERLAARKIVATSPFGAMLGSVMDGALSFADFQEDFDVARYGHSIIDMVGTCVDLGLGSGGTASSVRADTILIKAKKMLSDNIDNPDFDFTQLASKLNASPRTVSRAFATEGTTAIRWLWSQRLERAYHLATEGSALNVSQIALRCGFSDFAHFSRSFKKAYGYSPSAAMNQHLQPQ